MEITTTIVLCSVLGGLFLIFVAIAAYFIFFRGKQLKSERKNQQNGDLEDVKVDPKEPIAADEAKEEEDDVIENGDVIQTDDDVTVGHHDEDDDDFENLSVGLGEPLSLAQEIQEHLEQMPRTPGSRSSRYKNILSLQKSWRGKSRARSKSKTKAHDADAALRGSTKSRQSRKSGKKKSHDADKLINELYASRQNAVEKNGDDVSLGVKDEISSDVVVIDFSEDDKCSFVTTNDVKVDVIENVRNDETNGIVDSAKDAETELNSEAIDNDRDSNMERKVEGLDVTNVNSYVNIAENTTNSDALPSRYFAGNNDLEAEVTFGNIENSHKTSMYNETLEESAQTGISEIYSISVDENQVTTLCTNGDNASDVKVKTSYSSDVNVDVIKTESIVQVETEYDDCKVLSKIDATEAVWKDFYENELSDEHETFDIPDKESSDQIEKFDITESKVREATALQNIEDREEIPQSEFREEVTESKVEFLESEQKFEDESDDEDYKDKSSMSKEENWSGSFSNEMRKLLAEVISDELDLPETNVDSSSSSDDEAVVSNKNLHDFSIRTQENEKEDKVEIPRLDSSASVCLLEKEAIDLSAGEHVTDDEPIEMSLGEGKVFEKPAPEFVESVFKNEKQRDNNNNEIEILNVESILHEVVYKTNQVSDNTLHGNLAEETTSKDKKCFSAFEENGQLPNMEESADEYSNKNGGKIEGQLFDSTDVKNVLEDNKIADNDHAMNSEIADNDRTIDSEITDNDHAINSEILVKNSFNENENSDESNLLGNVFEDSFHGIKIDSSLLATANGSSPKDEEVTETLGNAIDPAVKNLPSENNIQVNGFGEDNKIGNNVADDKFISIDVEDSSINCGTMSKSDEENSVPNSDKTKICSKEKFDVSTANSFVNEQFVNGDDKNTASDSDIQITNDDRNKTIRETDESSIGNEKPIDPYIKDEITNESRDETKVKKLEVSNKESVDHYLPIEKSPIFFEKELENTTDKPLLNSKTLIGVDNPVDDIIEEEKSMISKPSDNQSSSAVIAKETLILPSTNKDSLVEGSNKPFIENAPEKLQFPKKQPPKVAARKPSVNNLKKVVSMRKQRPAKPTTSSSDIQHRKSSSQHDTVLKRFDEQRRAVNEARRNEESKFLSPAKKKNEDISSLSEKGLVKKRMNMFTNFPE